MLGNWFEKIAAGKRIQTPLFVVKRSVYEELGVFDRRLDCNEDWEMGVRIPAYYQFAHTPAILDSYRSLKSAASYQMLKNGVEFGTIRAVKARMDGVSGDKITKVMKKARSRTQAEYWLKRIPVLIEGRDVALYFRVLLQALHYLFSFRTAARAIRLTIRALIKGCS